MHRILFALFSLLLTTVATAQATFDESSVPPALKEWRGWVLKDLEYRGCPFLATQTPGERSAHVCAWPARLEIAADASGANFNQRWRVDIGDWIPLPGDSEHWPQDVSVDGRPAIVLVRDGNPAVWLAAGSAEIRGRIPWVQRPQQLRVPDEVGLIALRVDGKVVEPLERSDEELTLGRGETAEPEADSLSLRVFRHLADGIPAVLTTQIQFDVAGQAREETLAPVLPEGFVPVSLEGELPARLDPDGKLHAQVQPGSWTMTLTARATAPLAKVTARLGAEPWPQQEIWSYAGAPSLRVTSASAANPIDPAQAGVPEAWRSLPAFALSGSEALSVEERSRGLNVDEANRLSLAREAWLDFSGSSLYAKDRIGGRMQRDWRLDVAPPYRLERAEADGEGLLVTHGASPNDSGVELRNPQVNLAAGLRIGQGGGSVPITGWKQAFDNVNLTLHLPYGYRLLGAPGADVASGSWISLWNLMDVFIVAVAALLAWRLLGFLGGGLALSYLVLSYHEPDAPLWALLFTVALALLLKALPIGKLQTTARWLARAALVALVLVTLPFLANQVRYALYPQLEPSAYQAYGYGREGMLAGNMNAAPQQMMEEAQMQNAPVDAMPATSAPAPMAPPPPPVEAPPAKPMARAEMKSQDVGRLAGAAGKLETIVIGGSAVNQRSLITNRYAKNATIQAGRGEPGWQYGNSYALSWSGPVLPEQHVRLVIAPPWLTRVLRVLMLALLLLTAANLAKRLFAAGSLSPSHWRAGGSTAALLVAVLGMGVTNARASEIPDANLLNELRNRLLEAPKCAPACANAARADVRVAGDAVHVALDIAAGERVAVPLPGADTTLALEGAKLDGIAVDGVAHNDELLWLAVGRGVHRIDLDFRTIDTDHLALKFPMQPARIAVSLDGWQAGGVSEQRLLGDTLTLTRERRETNAATPGRPVAQQFPPFVRVERNLVLDLDWSVNATANRLAPAEGGFSTRVELLGGEQVLSAGTKQEDGKVLLSFGADQDSINWNSRLERADTITLKAPPLGERAEVWRVTLSEMWHAEFSGVPEMTGAAGGGTHEFHPLPGETLTLKVTRPEAVEGKSFAIDAVSVSSSAGARALDTTLTMSLRSTQGGEHVIALPSGAEVLSLTKNGQVLNLRPREGKLSLPLTPGAQRFELRIRQAEELGTVARIPAFTLGAPAANVALDLNLPGDRWVLFTFGPAVGPAVLYWGELIVMILVAWALSRLRRTPLKLWHWVLLGFGFSAFSWGLLLVVVAWLFALDWRERSPAPKNDGVFNLAQIGLALLTLVALLCLIASIPWGLLGQPNMHITGNGSSPQQLKWFADQITDTLPTARAISLPMWAYKLTMLAWALWLANALVGWLRWGFAAWTNGGYWKSSPKKPKAPPPPAEPKAE